MFKHNINYYYSIKHKTTNTETHFPISNLKLCNMSLKRSILNLFLYHYLSAFCTIIKKKILKKKRKILLTMSYPKPFNILSLQ